MTLCDTGGHENRRSARSRSAAWFRCCSTTEDRCPIVIDFWHVTAY